MNDVTSHGPGGNPPKDMFFFKIDTVVERRGSVHSKGIFATQFQVCIVVGEGL